MTILVLTVLWWAWTFNRLVSWQKRIDEAVSQLDVQLKRRNDLLPNLINVTKAYAQYEQTTLAQLTALRKQTGQAGWNAPQMVQLSVLLTDFLARAEAYPTLKADQQFTKLSAELRYTEDKIAYARKLYNDTVARYNTVCQRFPDFLVAQVHHFDKRELLVTAANERAVPEVDDAL